MTESGQDRVPVLIVGAGPVGLATACALWRRGVPARIVEAANGPNLGSRAVQLHPPTLRVFAELGMLADAEALGLKIRTTSYHLASGRTLKVTLGAENEPLMLPQEQTSRLLERVLEQLGGKVERSTTVTAVLQTEDSVTVSATSAGRTERISADYLIAADGVRSSVRDLLGVEFPGSPVRTNFLLAEGKISANLETDAVHYFLGRTGSVVFASMPGGRTRVSGAVADDYPMTAEGVQRLLDERGPGDVAVRGLDMVNSFTSQERIAARLRVGRCFLVGDAAHTHSPLGGQGLNLGLQDTHNLAWKLAGVIHGKLSPAILDTYEPERRQAAEHIVRTTRRFLQVFMLGPIGSRVRNLSWSTLGATGVLRRWFVPLLAGWRISYPDVLSGQDGKPRLGMLPKPGTRPAHWIADAVAAAPLDDRFRLLTLGSLGRGFTSWAAEIANRHPDIAVHQHIQPARATGFVLLRPDGYVAAAGTRLADIDRADRVLAHVAAR